jgi:hypothetical protein
VKEITDVVLEKVKTNNMDFVFEKSGVSLNGVPIVLYAPANIDFTNDIIAVLNKPGRSTAASAPSTQKTAASPSATPAKAVKP